MTLTIHPDVIQGSDEWLDVRRGILTASVVGNLITTRKLSAIDYDCPDCGALAEDPCRSKVKQGVTIKTLHPGRADVARQSPSPVVLETASNDSSQGLTMMLAAERITGWTEPQYISDDMLRGIDDEPRARGHYNKHYAPVTEVGFITEDRFGFKIGYSPDGLVGDDGLIEVKSRRAKLQLATILADEVPIDAMAQLQCGLLVTGRQWIDYLSYSGGMPMWLKRVEPQQTWFDAITEAATIFEENVAEMIRTYEQAIAGLHPTERSFELEMTI